MRNPDSINKMSIGYLLNPSGSAEPRPAEQHVRPQSPNDIVPARVYSSPPPETIHTFGINRVRGNQETAHNNRGTTEELSNRYEPNPPEPNHIFTSIEVSPIPRGNRGEQR